MNAARASTSGATVSGSRGHPLRDLGGRRVGAGGREADHVAFGEDADRPLVVRRSTTTEPTLPSRMRCAASATVSAGWAVTTGRLMMSATVRSRRDRPESMPACAASLAVGTVRAVSTSGSLRRMRRAARRPPRSASRPRARRPSASVACAVAVLDAHRVVDATCPTARSTTCGRRAGSVAGSAASSCASADRGRRARRPARSAGWRGPCAAPRRRDTPRPVRMRSSACEWPIRRGRRTVPPSIERHAPAAAEHAEHRVARGDAQVAPQRELEAARDRVALDRGDHRLRRAACGSAPSVRRRLRCTRLPRPAPRSPSGRRPRRTCRRRR